MMKSKEYRPIRAASSMIGHGVSSRSSHSCPAGPDDVLGEVVDPLLDLQLVLVEVEGEFSHRPCSVPALVGLSRHRAPWCHRRIAPSASPIEPADPS